MKPSDLILLIVCIIFIVGFAVVARRIARRKK